MKILVKTNYPVEDYKHIASKIMSYDSVYAEQVGFIEKPINNKVAARLQMAGGEFCDNACMALAAFIASKRGVEYSDLAEISLEASGAEELIICQVKRNSDEFYCQVTMPIPKKIEQRTIKYDGNDLNMIIVKYQDCIHIVIEVAQFSKTVRKSTIH